MSPVAIGSKSSSVLKLVSRHTSSFHTNEQALRLPPGPSQLPLIGSLHHFLLSRFRDLPHRAMRELSETYGPLMMLRLGDVPTLVVSSAEAAEEVLKTNDISFCGRPLSATMDIITYGGQDIICSPYNDRWRELRKICTLELFHQRRVLQFRHVREDEAGRLIGSIYGECSVGRPIVNVSEKIYRVMNDISVRTAIGSRCKHQDEFLHELHEVLRLTGGFNLVDLYPSSQLIRRLSTSARDIGKCKRKIYGIIVSIIHERANTSAPDVDDDLLGVLLRLQKDGGLQFALSNEIISSVIFDIFAAGSHTSLMTLEWALSELIKNPRVLQKVQLEVRDTFKGQDMLTEENMTKLNYLHLVIKETLRLHPPMVPRACRETCRVMGYDVPKDTAVFVNSWAIGRDKKYWDAADEFRPERFKNSSIDFKGTDFEYIPFGAGRRICPGITLAWTNMELILASLLYHFDWQLPGGVKSEDLDMTESFAVNISRKSELWLHAKPRVNKPAHLIIPGEEASFKLSITIVIQTSTVRVLDSA
ncbi:hypothetical protein ACP70R_030048 [Stipagrostis hirtigluma subsp. patula]